MTVNIDQDHVTISPALANHIEEKVNELANYLKEIIQADVILKEDKNDHEEDRIVEIRLKVPNTVLFASGKGKNFKSATSDSMQALVRQIKKWKEKYRSRR